MKIVVALAVVLCLSLGLNVGQFFWHGGHDVVYAGGTPSGNGDVNASGGIDIADAIYLLAYLFGHGPVPEPIESSACDSCCPPSQTRVPATGQTVCYDAAGNQVDCNDANWPGQDALYQTGCTGEGRFVDNGDGTVTDNCTGLMWQKTPPPGTRSWQNALKYCENLALAEHSDWRLPNVRELLSIMDYGRLNPSLEPVFAPGTGWYWYWSSSTAQDLPSYAWIVGFFVGITKGYDKNDATQINVRAVRS